MKAQRLICTDVRRIELEDFELPRVPDNGILVQNDYTAVSVGTEIYNYAYGGEPSRARTFPRPTGYCNTGVVLEVGKDVKGIELGDRIAAQGNHASHAVMSGNFFRVPEGVSPRSAAFMVMCAIAMHGHRVGRPELGEVVAITGMGIVGQLAATFARMAGALPVIAIDLDDFRLGKARDRGADVCINPDGRGCRRSRARALRGRWSRSGHRSDGYSRGLSHGVDFAAVGWPPGRAGVSAGYRGSEFFARGSLARDHNSGRASAQDAG